MTYAAWGPRHRVTTIAPGKLDTFVLTLVNGRRAAIDAVVDYERALARARSFHRDNPCQMKVLPVTADELFNMLGIAPTDRPLALDPEDQRLMVATLKGVLRDSADPDARADALALLTDMGVVAV